MRPLKLQDTFTFGVHKDEQVEDVVEDHPDYIRWLIEHRDFQFDEEVLEALSKRESRR